MSRSYRKHDFFSYHNGSDKEYSRLYHQTRRAYDHRILKECENFYRNCKLFKPYEKVCPLYGDVCYIDEWYYDDPTKWVVDKKELNEYPENGLICMGCGWSENSYDPATGNFEYAWESAPDEKFYNKEMRNLHWGDTWVWPKEGGPSYRGGIDRLNKEFNEDVFGYQPRYIRNKTIWERYLNNVEAIEIGYGFLSSSDWFDLLFLHNKIPLNFETQDQLVDWLVTNQRRIVKSYYKYYLSK